MIFKPKRQRVYVEMSDGSLEYLADGEYELEDGGLLIYNSIEFKDEIDSFFIFNPITKKLISSYEYQHINKNLNNK